MDREEMSALDVRFMSRELQSLIGSRVRKIYQYTNEFLVEFFSPGHGAHWLHIDGSSIYLTAHKSPGPEPPSFCMFLRKHLMGKPVRSVRQHLFDRVVEIVFPEAVIVIELVPPGNVILCDSSYTIIMPLKVQRWRDREVRPKVLYHHPPANMSIFDMSAGQFQKMLKRSDKSVASFLAVHLGLGGLYAREACRRAGILGSTPSKDMTLETATHLRSAVNEMDRSQSATRYDDTVTPFRLTSMDSGVGYGSFSEALDAFFAGRHSEKNDSAAKEEKERMQRIRDMQEKAHERLAGKKGYEQETAERIYSHYSLVDGILQGIRKAREQGLSWHDVKERVRTEATEEAAAIREIREGEGIVVAELGGEPVELDIRLSVEQNAARHFEDAKTAGRKLAGVAEARKVTEQNFAEIPAQMPAQQAVKKTVRKKWYEKFHWFTSSDGFLVIGGKNARQNEMIFSKYMNPGDKVFHADIPGAALVVVQSGGRDATIETMKEAAEFAAAHSKAWSKGLGAVGVYCVNPEQVSKSPPSGMALAKGSFFITGERQWFRSKEVKLAVGTKIDREHGGARILTGPVFSLRKNTDYFITIKPGLIKALELARSVKNKLLMRSSPEDKHWIEDLPLEDIQASIPAGTGEIVDFG